MSRIIQSNGTQEGFIKSALMGSNAVKEDTNGRFYLDGGAVNTELSDAIAEAIYIGEIFRDGQSVTKKYTADTKAMAVRVLLDTPFPSTSRTLSYGGRRGTLGNAGKININARIMPTNDEMMVFMNQVNDQILFFPDINKNAMPLDTVAKKIAGYTSSVVQDRSASTLAEILAYAIYRSLNAGDNITHFELGSSNMLNVIADLNTKLDNGDIANGVFSFSTTGRTIIGRPSFINKIFTKESGIAVLGSDLAMSMLKNYDIDADVNSKGYVGSNYVGQYGTFHFQKAPDYIWQLAEKYLQLPAGALKHIHAIAVSFEATAMGTVLDLGVKMVDASGSRGVEAQPLNIWGHEAFRISHIIGDSTVTNDYFKSIGFSENERVYPIAPGDLNKTFAEPVSVPVYSADGTIVAYREIAKILNPNGGNIQSGAPTAATPVFKQPDGTSFDDSLSVEITSATDGASIHYTTDGTTPTSTSPKYTGAISVTATTTIKAVSVKEGYLTSKVAEASYTKQ